MSFKEVMLDGEIYYLYGKQWVDSSFIAVPTQISQKIIRQAYANFNFYVAPLPQLKEIVVEAKEAGCYDIALKAVDSIIEKAEDFSTVKAYISVKTSCLRSMSDPRGAIAFCTEMKQAYGSSILNTAALTSVASAYCDLGDWDAALKTAKYAYAKQGGGVGYSNELSLVFKRIEAEKR